MLNSGCEYLADLKKQYAPLVSKNPQSYKAAVDESQLHTMIDKIC